MRRLFFVSLGVAAVSFTLPPVLLFLGDSGWLTLFYPESVFWSSDLGLIVWLVIFGWAWYRHRWRSLWLLLGAPLVLIWPVWIGMILWSCLTGGVCL